MKSWWQHVMQAGHLVPHRLQRRAMSMMAVLVLLTFVATNVQSLIWLSSDWMVSTILPAVVVDLTNTERSKQSLTTLRRSAVLDEAAQLKAEHMAQNQYFAHYSPSGVSPWHWFAQVDYSFVHAGENLAIHFSDTGELVDAWMNSPTHRDNIMNGNYREIGVGTAEGMYDGYPTVYVVQLFGTPSAAPAVSGATETTPPPPRPTTPPPAPVIEEVEPVEVEPVIVAVAPVTEPERPTVVVMEDETEVEAESVSIVETVEIIPAPPVPVPETMIELAASEQGVTLLSDHLSTSTGGVPATLNEIDASAGHTTPVVLRVATQPQTVLQFFYTVLAFCITALLAASVLVEMRRRDMVQIAYSVGLLVLMAVLWSAHLYLTAGAVVV
jgi:hypothetical protein